MMKFLKKLNNPFVIGLNGFLAGAVLFFATHPEASLTDTTAKAPPAERSEARAGA